MNRWYDIACYAIEDHAYRLRQAHQARLVRDTRATRVVDHQSSIMDGGTADLVAETDRNDHQWVALRRIAGST